MADLIIHNIDETILHALQTRAAKHGVSIESEHRKILEQALLTPRRKSFADILCQIPNIGQDSDLERIQTETKTSPTLDEILTSIPEDFQYPPDVEDFVDSPNVGQGLSPVSRALLPHKLPIPPPNKFDILSVTIHLASS